MTGDEQSRTIVLDVLRQVAPEASTDTLDPNRSFRDQIGLDSIDFLNFVVGLEERLGVRIAETDYPQLSCLDGCLSYIQGHCASSTG